MGGISVARMKLFNTREDIAFYDVKAYDSSWRELAIVTSPATPIKASYLSHTKVEVFVRDRDVEKLTYICSRSKLLKKDGVTPIVETRICSKKM